MGHGGKGKGQKRDPKIYSPYKMPETTPVRANSRPFSPVVCRSPTTTTPGKARIPDLNEIHATLKNLVSQVGKVVNKMAGLHVPELND